MFNYIISYMNEDIVGSAIIVFIIGLSASYFAIMLLDNLLQKYLFKTRKKFKIDIFE